jgi:hypothetical protein
MESITLQTNDAIISSGDSIGQLQFAASNESDGSASRYVIGKIYAQGEGVFNASSNPASLVFATSASDNLAASGKIKISHEGHILPLQDNVYDLGSSSERFRHLYVADAVTSPTGDLSYLFFDTTVGDVDQVAGQLNWNSEAGTIDLGLTDDLTIHLGQSVLFRVKNSTGSTITKGEAVYASGVLGGGQIIQVAPFAANHSVDEVRFIGLMTDDLADGEDGFVNHFGHIKNVDLRTTNTALNPNAETWNIGDDLFVDDTSPGGLTKVQPKDYIYVALVLADGQNGELFVRIADPGHINELHDVNTSGLVDNNFLVWNSGNDVWEPSTTLTFDGTTLHTDTDGISAIFGRNNSLTNGGKVRILVDDNDTASSVQAIKAFNNKTTGTNYGINATANGLGATKNVGLYGWAAQATTNWGLWVDAGYSIFDDRVGIKTSSPNYELHVNGSGNITGDMIVGGNLTIQGNTVTANVATMEIEDPIFTLGLASGTIVTDTNLDRGLALALNNDIMAFMGWDVSESEFALLSSGVASNSSGNYAPGTYGDLHIGNLEASGGYFSGNVGIGTSSPSYPLHVVAGSSYAYFSSNAVSAIKSVRGSSQNAGIDIGNTVGTWTIGKATDGFFGFSHDNQNINGSALFAITTAGNVGIGDTSPSYKLDVNGTAGFSSTIDAPNIGAGEDNSVVILDSDGKLRTDEIDSRVWGSGLVDGSGNASYVARFTDANTLGTGLIYDNGTNVGIGTTTPSVPLHVKGRVRIQDSDNSSFRSPGTLAIKSDDNDPSIMFYNDDGFANGWLRMPASGSSSLMTVYNTDLEFGTNQATRMTIKSDSGSGNIGIGTTSPLYTLDVAGTGNFRGDVYTSGNVGIGTASPANKLDVVGSDNTTIASFSDGTDGVQIATRGTGRQQIDFIGSNIASINAKSSLYLNYDSDNSGSNDGIIFARNNNDESGTIDAIITEGKVGIGITSPLTPLHVKDGGSGSDGIRIDYGPSNTYNLRLDGVGGIRQWRGTGSNGGMTLTTSLTSGSWGGDQGGLIAFQPRDTEAARFDGLGNFGIGTASPSEKLDVSGNANISGHLSATTKSFLINHPTRPGHKLQYGSLESPYHGIRLTGRGTIQSGWCVIKLPEYICNLVRDDESVNIQITNYKHSKLLYVGDIDIANNEFTIKTDSWFTRNNLEFFWTFTAVRKDVEPLKVEF